jgi:hypothetical protein
MSPVVQMKNQVQQREKIRENVKSFFSVLSHCENCAHCGFGLAIISLPRIGRFRRMVVRRMVAFGEWSFGDWSFGDWSFGEWSFGEWSVYRKFMS